MNKILPLIICLLISTPIAEAAKHKSKIVIVPPPPPANTVIADAVLPVTPTVAEPTNIEQLETRIKSLEFRIRTLEAKQNE